MKEFVAGLMSLYVKRRGEGGREKSGRSRHEAPMAPEATIEAAFAEAA